MKKVTLLGILVFIFCIPFIATLIWMIYMHYKFAGTQANYTMLFIIGMIVWGGLGAYIFENVTKFNE